MEKVLKYKGKPIDSLTRDELIEAINTLVDELKAERAGFLQQLDFFLGLSKSDMGKNYVYNYNVPAKS